MKGGQESAQPDNCFTPRQRGFTPRPRPIPPTSTPQRPRPRPRLMHCTAISGNYGQETVFAEFCKLKSCNVIKGKRFEHKPRRICWGVCFFTFCNDDVDDDLLNLNLLICPHTHGSSTPLPSLMLITARADPPHTCVPSCVPICTKPPIHHQILQLVPA